MGITDLIRFMAYGTDAPIDELIDEFRRLVVESTLRAEGGRPSRAARRLGVTRECLYKWRKRYGLEIKDPFGEREIPADFRERLEAVR